MALFLPQRWRAQPQYAVAVSPEYGESVVCSPYHYTTANTAPYAVTQNGRAFSFDNISARSTKVGAPAPINEASAITLLWYGYYRTARVGAGNDQGVFGNRYSTNTNAFIQLIARNRSTAAPANSYTWMAQLKENTGASEIYAQDVANALADGFHLITATVDGASLRLYVDGALVGTTARNSTSFANHTNDWRAGTYFDDTATRRLNGDMIYGAALRNNALSAEQIAELWENPFGLFEKQTARIYSFPSATAAEGSGTIDGIGSLVGEGKATHSGSGEVSGVGSLVGAGLAVHSGSGTVDGVGSLAGGGEMSASGVNPGLSPWLDLDAETTDTRRDRIRRDRERMGIVAPEAIPETTQERTKPPRKPVAEGNAFAPPTVSRSESATRPVLSLAEARAQKQADAARILAVLEAEQRRLKAIRYRTALLLLAAEA
jgi:hypothetical protein